MNYMTSRCEPQASADRLQELRRRAPRRRAALSPEGIAVAQAAVARMERGEFDDEALAVAVASASASA